MKKSQNSKDSGSKVFEPRVAYVPSSDHPSKKQGWTIHTSSMGVVKWGGRMDRLSTIRQGVPYEAIEALCLKADMAVKHLLGRLGIPQTTYNKNKREKALLNRRDSEIILMLSELLDFGHEVFNEEKEKFQRWLQKTNLSLGGITPESLFDSVTGIQEVKNALNRLEYGNMA